MLKSFWFRAGPVPAARRLWPALLVSVMLAGGLTACAASTSSTTTPVATSNTSPGSTGTTPTVSPVTGTQTAIASFSCNALDPLIQVLQSNNQHVDFNISAAPNIDIKGSIVTYSVDSQFQMTGMGYMVSPNDPVQLQIDKGSDFVHITVKNVTTGQVTTYIGNACMTKTSTDIEVTGTTPYSFMLDMLITP